MKRIALFLLTFVTVLTGVSFTSGITVAPDEDTGVVTQIEETAPVLRSEQMMSNVVFETVKIHYTPALTKTDIPEIKVPVEVEPVIEEKPYRDDIPLTYDEQDWLLAACEENDIPFALALGLIERESTFRNILGDDGASSGYMQIQQRWHYDRMERLGVTDLTDPQSNFRVGCDFLAELYDRYGDWHIALTAYNMGHDPGYITNYAYGVMDNYARWQELLDTYE